MLYESVVEMACAPTAPFVMNCRNVCSAIGIVRLVQPLIHSPVKIAFRSLPMDEGSARKPHAGIVFRERDCAGWCLRYIAMLSLAMPRRGAAA